MKSKESPKLYTYNNILVSGVEYDFSLNRHENIPQQLYSDWASLIIKLAKVLYPAFDCPPLPDYLNFHTESIPSDAPYSANPDYYMLDYVYFELSAENGCGLKLSYENGRWGGENPVSIETIGFVEGVSSYIHKEAKSPRATLYIWHESELQSEIANIISLHQRSFPLKFMKWKTERSTILIERELKKIPFIDEISVGETGESFDKASEYVEINQSGEVIKRYGPPQAFSLDDEMTISDIYRVIEDCLYEFYYSQYAGSEARVNTTLLLSGLEIYKDVLPFDEGNLFTRL